MTAHRRCSPARQGGRPARQDADDIGADHHRARVKGGMSATARFSASSSAVRNASGADGSKDRNRHISRKGPTPAAAIRAGSASRSTLCPARIHPTNRRSLPPEVMILPKACANRPGSRRDSTVNSSAASASLPCSSARTMPCATWAGSAISAHSAKGARAGPDPLPDPSVIPRTCTRSTPPTPSPATHRTALDLRKQWTGERPFVTQAFAAVLVRSRRQSRSGDLANRA